jgi:hypothetical protein
MMVAYCNRLSWSLSGETEENHEILWSEWPFSSPRFKRRTSRIWSWSDSYMIAIFDCPVGIGGSFSGLSNHRSLKLIIQRLILIINPTRNLISSTRLYAFKAWCLLSIIRVILRFGFYWFPTSSLLLLLFSCVYGCVTNNNGFGLDLLITPTQSLVITITN